MLNQDSKRGWAFIALLFITASWGSTFFMIKDLLDRVPAIDFLGVRFLACGILAATIFAPRLRHIDRRTWIIGGGLGVIYAAAQVLQTVGLAYTDASISGFITGMYVVFTPIIAWLLYRNQLGRKMWMAVALAAVGLAVLSLRGFSFGYGETLTLISSLLFGFHVALIGHYVPGRDALAFTATQLITCGIVSFLAALPGGVVLPQRNADIVAIAYMVLIPALLALILQNWAQQYVTETQAAVTMTSEPVFAALFAIGFGGEALSARTGVGGAIIVAAMLLSQVPARYVPRCLRRKI
ncbi:MAG: DMT family transporter [Varibaculum sp.]|nr:DMT family transporter [Varibaculum sp.]